jgi:hypothetical protein
LPSGYYKELFKLNVLGDRLEERNGTQEAER